MRWWFSRIICLNTEITRHWNSSNREVILMLFVRQFIIALTAHTHTWVLCFYGGYTTLNLSKRGLLKERKNQLLLRLYYCYYFSITHINPIKNKILSGTSFSIIGWNFIIDWLWLPMFLPPLFYFSHYGHYATCGISFRNLNFIGACITILLFLQLKQLSKCYR